VGEEVSKVSRSKKRSVCEVVLIIFLLSLLYLFLRPSGGQNLPQGQLEKSRAAILDQLSLYLPNQAFVQSSTAILTNAGFEVDYYGGDAVTVDLYRRLPSLGYKLIIMRVHSGLLLEENEITKNVTFFTSEPYSTTEHVLEQLRDQVVPAIVSFTPVVMENMPVYFAITPEFVKSSMDGRFENTVIIMMGCDGLVYTPMAEAFIGRGTLAYIGWNDVVTIDYVDNATLHLLNGLIAERKTIWDAVWDTREEIGPDPNYSANLVFYPVEVGGYTVVE